MGPFGEALPVCLHCMTDHVADGKPHRTTRALAAIGVGATFFLGARFLLNYFGPAIPYSMPEENKAALDSHEFIQFLSIVTDGTLCHSRISRLKNGVEFYPAQLESIRRAKQAINLEFYEFKPGQVGDEMLASLTEQAAAGVEVRVIIDALGSFGTPDSYFDGLRAAGGQMRWYHPLRWNTWPNANNRTHRKLLIVDGETGFIGGAGVGDHWLVRNLGSRPARYSLLRRRRGGGRPHIRLLRKLARGLRRDSFRRKTICFPRHTRRRRKLRGHQHAPAAAAPRHAFSFKP